MENKNIKKILGDAYRHNRNYMRGSFHAPKKVREEIELHNSKIRERLDEIGLLFSRFFKISYNNAIIELDAYADEENMKDHD